MLGQETYIADMSPNDSIMMEQKKMVSESICNELYRDRIRELSIVDKLLSCKEPQADKSM